MLEDKQVTVTAIGTPVEIRMDNSNAWDETPFLRTACPTFNGHLLVIVKAGCISGQTALSIVVEGLSSHEITLSLV